MLGVVDTVCAEDELTREERALVMQLAGLLARARGWCRVWFLMLNSTRGIWWRSQGCPRSRSVS